MRTMMKTTALAVLSGMVMTIAPAYSSSPAPLTTVTTAAGPVLANANGMTVYTFDRDNHGPSVCYDGCAKAWPPVLVGADVKVTAPLTTQARRDGSLQLVLNGDPLYLYISDRESTDINGDGLGGVWHIVREPAAFNDPSGQQFDDAP